MPTVLITGANRGIGLEFARQYAADGCKVIGAARRPDAAGELHRLGVEVQQLDAADPASIAALAASLAGRPIDLLIANAGVFGGNDLDPAAWEEVLRTNLIGPTLLAQTLRPNVAASGLKRMVALTSAMASIAETGGGQIPYRSSKAALNMAWRNLALDYARDGIAVAVISPGWVQTDMGGPNATISVEESVAGMRRVIEALSPRQSGRFLSWDGRELPW
jgi:NAD(P)-dependent dehydrogenase (short-subunit alcohol dehydrogenase family)